MKYQDLERLPIEIQEAILDPDMSHHNREIFDKYYFNEDMEDFLLDIEGAIFLKEIDPVDMPGRLEEMPNAKRLDVRALALDVATLILWPLQEYLGSVDRLILRLGGKIPRLVHLQKAPLQNKSFPDSARGGVRGMLQEYEEFKNLKLSRNKMVDKDGRHVPGTVENWIKDYIHMVGAGSHDSLQRSKYLSDGYNVKSLDSDELESLRNFLLSYDNDEVVNFENKDGYVIVSTPKSGAEKPSTIDLDDVLAQLESKLFEFSDQLLTQEIIMSEAKNNPQKLGDVLWNALGNGDATKTVSTLRVMQLRSSIVSILSADIRYKNLLKRFVSVKYGSDVENWAAENTDIDLSMRLYLQMFLEEKLGLSTDEAALYAFYISKLKPVLEAPVYLDQSDGQLHWRELRVDGNKLFWSHPTK